MIPGDVGDGESGVALPGLENEDCLEDPDARAGEVGCELTRDERLKREAASAEHSLTHRPKNPFCWVCGLSKMSAKPARRVGPDDHSVNPTCFGEHVCADHITGLYDEAEGIGGQHAALLITCRVQNPDMQRAGASVRRRAGGPVGQRVRRWAGGSAGRQAGASGLGGRRLDGRKPALDQPGRRLFVVSPGSQNGRSKNLFGGTNVLIPM